MALILTILNRCTEGHWERKVQGLSRGASDRFVIILNIEMHTPHNTMMNVENVIGGSQDVFFSILFADNLARIVHH